MVKIKCKVCYKEFEVKACREKSAQYCGLKCRSTGIYLKMKEEGRGLAIVDGRHSIGNKHRKGMKPTNSYTQGHTPWNKGVKGLHFSPKTEFMKGSIPINKLSVGTITKRKDRHEMWRNYIKIAEPNLWEPYAVFLWKKAYGEIKEDYVIHHINKDALDDRLENFETLTRAEHLEVHRKDFIKSKDSRFINETAVFI